MPQTRLLLFAQLAAFWPVWIWYAQRMVDGSDEPWGVLALLTVLVLTMLRGKVHRPASAAVGLAAAVAGVYAVAYGFLPPLFRAALAAVAVAVTLSAIGYGRIVHAGVLGLMLLSLPLIASLQFYGGFPIRVVTAFASSQLLGLAGYDVDPQGTLLHWAGEVIAVDAPCAGIKMLWSALYLNFTLALWRNLGFLATWLCTSFTLLSIFLGNILRATLLFFTESGIVRAPEFAHQGIGLIVFALVAAAVASFHHYRRRYSACVG